MYRFVIEHPRWIGKERLAQLDVRAGANMGRIYRIVPENKPLRAVPNLRALSTAKLVAALDTPNGTVRDLAQIEIVHRNEVAAVQPLVDLAERSKLPAVRIQALSVLEGIKFTAPAMPAVIEWALTDKDVHVRRQAIRLSENYLNTSPALQQAVLKMTGDAGVRYQLALSLGEWNDAEAGRALGEIGRLGLGDPWIRAAVLSSAANHPVEILEAAMTAPPGAPGRGEMTDQLIATAVGKGEPELLAQTLAVVVPAQGGAIEEWHYLLLKSLLDALDRKKISLDTFASSRDEDMRSVVARIKPMFEGARKLAADKSASDDSRAAAARLLGREADHHEEDLALLGTLLGPGNPLPVEKAALDALKHEHGARVPGLLLADWNHHSPSLRTAILETLLSRDESIKTLLAAVKDKRVSAAEITAAQRQRLLKHPNEEIRKEAAAVLKSGTTASRAEAMARYQDATKLPGDVEKGRTIFGKNCTPCHQLKGQGFAVGPNLAALVEKTPDDFLLAIIDPNAAVEPRFLAYNIDTKDDRSLIGVISAETATSLTLSQPGGIQEKILRSDITGIKATGLSLMPEGFEQAITVQELADLIAYLRTAPAPFGSASTEKTAAARRFYFSQGADEIQGLLAVSEGILYPSWMGELPLGHCRQTDGKSHVVWQSKPVKSELKADGKHQFRIPAAMGWLSAPAGKFALSINGKHALDFDVVLNDKTWTSADNRVTMRYTVMENNAEDSNGVLAIDVSDSMIEPGKPVTFEVTGSASGSQRWFGVYQVSKGEQQAAK
jgi:putative heme-binding domain-containing protein